MHRSKLMVAALFWSVSLATAFAGGLDDASPETLVNNWIGAVVSGDKEAIKEILAPEFQLVRGSGNAYNNAEYLASGLPKITVVLNISDINSSAGGDIMVVRYWLVIDETVDGQVLQKRAPRLTVFRNIEGHWFVSAHANFAVPKS